MDSLIAVFINELTYCTILIQDTIKYDIALKRCNFLYFTCDWFWIFVLVLTFGSVLVVDNLMWIAFEFQLCCIQIFNHSRLRGKQLDPDFSCYVKNDRNANQGVLIRATAFKFILTILLYHKIRMYVIYAFINEWLN